MGIDITEGTALIDQHVRDKLEEMKVRDMMFTTANSDPLRLLVFRIAGTSFRDYKIFEIANEKEVEKKFTDAVNWMLKSTPASGKSSIATGLFNVLEVDNEFRRREVIFFGDGMEHDKQEKKTITVSFYEEPAALLPVNQDDTIARLQKVRRCPDLSYVDRFRWQIPPMMGQKVRNNETVFRQVQVLWEATLTKACHVPKGKAEVVY